MWLTLVRPNEAVQVEWSEIDLEEGLWRIQAHRMKRRQEHHIPLPRQAIDLLRTMNGISGNQKHVFPHRDLRGHPMKLETLRQAIYKTH
jgi:integrase